MKININKNIFRHKPNILRHHREAKNRHKSLVVWLTGLSGSGKSTIAHEVEKRLHEKGCKTYVLDGDNVRHGLCSDLKFSHADRTENIRRIAEVSKLFLDAGIIALNAFVSPFSADRDYARAIIGEKDFIEVYCKCPVEVCEQRDIKGLYKKARTGEVQEFTGISSPYIIPESPDLVLDTYAMTIDECANTLVDLISTRLEMRHEDITEKQPSFLQPLFLKSVTKL